MSNVDLIFGGVSDLFKRIIYGNVKTPYRSYELFHEIYPMLHGGTWIQNLLAYLPGPGATYPVEFYTIVHGVSFGYTAPPDFYTEAYINFGWYGVAVISTIWGFVLIAAQVLIANKNKRNLYNMSFYVMAVVLFGFVSTSGLSFIVSGILVYIIITSVVYSQILMRKTKL